MLKSEEAGCGEEAVRSKSCAKNGCLAEKDVCNSGAVCAKAVGECLEDECSDTERTGK